MSDTATGSTRAPHAGPAPEATAGLTGAQAAIHTALLSLTESVTAAEIALAAHVGRSTTGKALTTLEQRNLAIRTPGGHDGPRRVPDLWRAAPVSATTTGDDSGCQEPDAAALNHPTADSPAPVGNDADHVNAATPTATVTPASPTDGDDAGATNPPAAEAPQDEPSHNPENAEAVDSGKDKSHTKDIGNDSSGEDGARVAQASGDRQSAPMGSTRVPGGKKRLAPGGLRQMVIDHLRAHPGEAFTATRISRVIEKSSGAIANALVTLKGQGVAEQVTERPRTYRLATAQDNR